ncbi:MAG TPA: hypothetical protein VHI98_07665 [Vicinamibacterales bacterium]|nr:hypothetical protein [Vicinamibacterales bacterium]
MRLTDLNRRWQASSWDVGCALALMRLIGALLYGVVALRSE